MTKTLAGIPGIDSVVKDRIKGHLLQWIRSRADSPSMEVKRGENDVISQAGTVLQQQIASVGATYMVPQMENSVPVNGKLPSFDVFKRETQQNHGGSMVGNHMMVQTSAVQYPQGVIGIKSLQYNGGTYHADHTPVAPTNNPTAPITVSVNHGNSIYQVASLPSPVNMVQRCPPGSSAALPTDGARITTATVLCSSGVSPPGCHPNQTQLPASQQILSANVYQRNDVKNGLSQRRHCVPNTETLVTYEVKKQMCNQMQDNTVKALKPVHFVRPVAVLQPTYQPIPLNPTNNKENLSVQDTSSLNHISLKPERGVEPYQKRVKQDKENAAPSVSFIQTNNASDNVWRPW